MQTGHAIVGTIVLGLTASFGCTDARVPADDNAGSSASAIDNGLFDIDEPHRSPTSPQAPRPPSIEERASTHLVGHVACSSVERARVRGPALAGSTRPASLAPALLRGATLLSVKLTVELDREEDGRIIAEVLELPGVMAYGKTREEAIAKVQALAPHVVAEKLEQGELVLDPMSVSL